MSIIIGVICDGCGKSGAREQGRDRGRPHLMRAELRGMRWAVGLPGGRDLCPACVEREREGRRGEREP